MAKSVYYLFFSLFLLLVSCHRNKDLSVEPTVTVDFYPLQKGSFRIYDVTSSNYGLTGQQDSLYQLKESFLETWTDLEGQTSYKLFRLKKLPNDTVFKLDSVWHVKSKSNQLIVTENNVPFVKLNYPLSDGKTWDGNSFNTFGTQNYKVSNTGKAWGNFSNTVTITQKYSSNLLVRSISLEVYAKDIGLVYKEIQDVKLEFSTQRIVEGKVIKQTLLNYGVE